MELDSDFHLWVTTGYLLWTVYWLLTKQRSLFGLVGIVVVVGTGVVTHMLAAMVVIGNRSIRGKCVRLEGVYVGITYL